jgi:hypothetical protein
VIPAEVVALPEDDNNAIAVQVHQAREQLAAQFRVQAEQLQKLEQNLKELRDEHERLESETRRQFGAIEKFKLPSPPTPLEAVLAAVRSLVTATLPEQVFNKLTEEAHRMGVRALVFEVRGEAAWGTSAHGFEPEVTEQDLRSLVVPLNVDTPFRQVFEIGQDFAGNSDALKNSPDVWNRLKLDSCDSVLLLPIRSAGAVSAVLYTDSGESGAALPEDALKLLAEFASAQLDRLMALSAGEKAAVGKDAGGEVPAESPVAIEPPTAAVELPVEVAQGIETPASWSEPSGTSIAEPQAPPPAPPVTEAVAPVGPPAAEAPAEMPAAGATIGFGPTPGALALPEIEAQRAVGVPPAPAPGGAFDVSQLSEAERKIQKDARRFARLLVFEIELYNKTQVAEGRKAKDLYKRLRIDIDRSRQSFEQRFGKSLGKQFDYFHDELVRTLAGNDPSLLGSDYPGPSV